MKKNIFEYKDYRTYLIEWLKAQPSKGRGMRSQMAKVLNCQSSHISQIFSGVSEISLEQASLLNEFLGHSEQESHFFILLVQWSRAGNQSLKKYFLNQIQKINQDRLVLKNRFQENQTITQEDQVVFFSYWYYSAIVVALTIEGLQTKDLLCKRLGLSHEVFLKAMEFLIDKGFVVKQGGLYQAGQTRIFLGSDALMFSKLHTNWRVKAIASLENSKNKDDLHYSTVVSVSKKDFINIKKDLVDSIESARNKIKDSPAEELYVFCLDFFEL